MRRLILIVLSIVPVLSIAFIFSTRPRSAKAVANSLSTCSSEYALFEQPQENSVLIAGNTYTLSGWACAKVGTLGAGNRIAVYVYDSPGGDWNANHQTLGIATSVIRTEKEVQCGGGMASSGWTYRWSVPANAQPGTHKLWIEHVSANATSTGGAQCSQWGSRTITIESPSTADAINKSATTNMVKDNSPIIDNGRLPIVTETVKDQAVLPRITISRSPPLCRLNTSGDADCNNEVDETDYEIWRSFITGGIFSKYSYSTEPLLNTGKTVDGQRAVDDVQLSIVKGYDPDFNNDQTIDLKDFEVWRNYFYRIKTSY